MQPKTLLKNIVNRELSDKTFQNDDELYLYLILIAAASFAMLIHIVLLFSFIIIGEAPMAIHNVACILIYAVCFCLIKYKHFAAAGLLTAADVLLYSCANVYWFGAGYYILFYLLITLIMQIIIPYASSRVRGAVVGVTWVTMIAIVLAGIYYTPPRSLGSAGLYISLFNLHIGFLGALLELSIGNYIKRIITQYNAEQMAKMTDQAHTDPLTGLHNRRYADKYFQRIASDAGTQRYCVAMLDIDDFKKVNDTFGHNTGDIVLKEVAAYVRSHLRKTDAVFRWGGEEFLLLTETSELASTHRVLDKLRLGLEALPIHTEHGTLHITVTIGMAEFDPANIDQCIDLCDKNMYSGKQGGKNRVVA